MSGILDNTKHEKMENPALHAKFSWFSHDLTKIQHWRVIDRPEFLLLWTVSAAKDLYSKKLSLRRDPSFCDRVRLNPHEYILSNLLISIARTFF